MTDINKLTNDELAAAVDLYVQKVGAKLRSAGLMSYNHVQIEAQVASDKYTIKHSLAIGYGVEHKWNGNNLLYGASVIISRIEEDKHTAPNEVCLSLPAPVGHCDYAEFTEVDEGMPF